MAEKPPATERRPLGTIEDVAVFLNVTPRHVHNLVRTRRIKAIKLGRCLRFDIDAIARQLSEE